MNITTEIIDNLWIFRFDDETDDLKEFHIEYNNNEYRGSFIDELGNNFSIPGVTYLNTYAIFPEDHWTYSKLSEVERISGKNNYPFEILFKP